MSNIKIVIVGDPVALKRARFHHVKAKSGKEFTSTYDPSKKDKKVFLAEAISQNRPSSPLGGPINLVLRFYMQRPKNHYGTGKKSNMLKANSPYWHTKRPDVDNFIKLVLDAFNETYWRDDSQVCKISSEKIYTNNRPRTEIEIIKL